MFFLNNIKSNNKCALISDNQKITYKELINLSSNISKKINSRSLVFFLSSNDIESIAGYIGLANSNSTTGIGFQ